MGKRSNVWDIIAWLALVGIGAWVLLKIFGVIKTPLFIEYAPIGGAIYIAGWAMHKLDRATEDIKEVKNNLKVIESGMGKIRMNCPALLNKN
jgi:hypothetical protein